MWTGPLIVIFRSKRDSVQNSFPNHTKPRTPSTSTPSRLIQTWSRKSWTRSYLRFSKTGRADLWTMFTSQLRRMYVENAEEEKHASSRVRPPYQDRWAWSGLGALIRSKNLMQSAQQAIPGSIHTHPSPSRVAPVAHSHVHRGTHCGGEMCMDEHASIPWGSS